MTPENQVMHTFVRRRFGSGSFARAVDEFERTGSLPARPDTAELLLRLHAVLVDGLLLDDEDDRDLRARQKLLALGRSDDRTTRLQAREQLRRSALQAGHPWLQAGHKW